MNITLWALQVLLCLHTLMGAVWKFSHSQNAVRSLKAIPHGVWLGISVLELLLSLCLVVPALDKSLGILAPVAALCIGAIMLLYVAIHFYSGAPFNGQVIYWLVVMVFCSFMAYGRFVLRPL